MDTSLKLRVTSYQRLAPGLEATRELRGGRITIGRAPDNDWVLPDPERKLSRHHCIVERRGSDFVLIDTSANGVFVDHDDDPLGRGRSLPLRDGSTLALGDYEIAIQIDCGASASKAPTMVSAFDEELLPHSSESQAAADQRSLEPVREPSSPPRAPRSVEPERIDDWLALSEPYTADLLPDDWDALGDHASAEEHRDTGPRVTAEPARAAGTLEHGSAARAPRGEVGSDQAVVAAFLRGVGLPNLEIAETEAAELMEDVGKMLRELVGGLMEVLADRRVLKDEFRLSQTRIKSAANNPLKFLPTPDEALRAILVHRGPAYMGPVEAVQEGFEDLRAHQMAVIAGTEAALRRLLSRFDPQALEQRLGSQSVMESLLSGARKRRYWDVFKDLYAEIAQEAQDDYENLFGREFSRAYEEQVRKR